MEKKATEYNEFNWVKSRQNCSVDAQFQLLQSTVKANVTERKEHLGENGGVKLTFESSSETEFRVTRRDSSSGSKGVVFRRREDFIFVQDDEDGDKTFTLKPVPNDDGECKFKVDGEEGEFLRWQVARKALEDILF